MTYEYLCSCCRARLLATPGLGVPTLHIPEIKTAWLGGLTKGALAIAFIGLMKALSIAKAIANESKQKLDTTGKFSPKGSPT